MENNQASNTGTLVPWLIWFAVSVFVIFQQYVGTFYGLTTEQLAKMYNVSKDNITLMAGVYFLSYGLMQIPAGLLLDRVNKRFLMSMASGTALLGMVVFALIPNFAFGMLATLLLGLGTSFVFVGAATLFIEWFPPKRFALVMGLFGGAACIGTGVLCSLTTKYVAHTSMRLVLIGVTLLSAVTFVLTLALVHGRRRTPEEGEGNTAVPQINVLRSLKEVLGGGQGWLAAIYNALLFGPALAFCSFWNFPYQEAYHHSTSKAVMINNMVLLGLAVGAPLAGWFSDKIGRRVLTAQLFGAASLFCMILILSDVVFSTTLVFIIMFLYGAFSYALPVGYAFAKEHTAPENHGTMVGLCNTLTFGSITILQIIPGTFYSHMKTFYSKMYTYDSAMLIFPLCTTGALVATFFMKETYCKPQR